MNETLRASKAVTPQTQENLSESSLQEQMVALLNSMWRWINTPTYGELRLRGDERRQELKSLEAKFVLLSKTMEASVPSSDAEP